MADTAATAEPEVASKATLRTVIAASSAGTTFEWYDFFVFGSLTGIISKTFFSGLPETAGLIRSARSGVAPLLAMDETMF